MPLLCLAVCRNTVSYIVCIVYLTRCCSAVYCDCEATNMDIYHVINLISVLIIDESVQVKVE